MRFAAPGRTFTITGAALAVALLVALAIGGSAAHAATTETFPAAGDARTFATTAGGWTSTVNNGCGLPGVGCPAGGAAYSPTGGAGTAPDGHLRSTYGTLLGIAATTSVTWTSPAFTSTQPTDTGTLSVGVRSDLARLLGINGTPVRLAMTLIDTADSSRNVVLTSGTDVPDSATFAPIAVSVPAGAMTSGRSYRIALRSTMTTGLATLAGSGAIDYDNVSLQGVDLLPPTGLTASADTSGAIAINGSVNPAGQSTSVVVDYGATTSYGSTTSPVVVTGSTPQTFSIPLAGLPAGSTVHYRVRATNADGPVSTPDAAFVVPAAPGNTPPALSGALNARARTISYDVTPGTIAVTAEILQGTTVVSSTVDPTPGDGTLAITLPDADGTYGVRLVRTNASGNASTSATVTTTLDRVAPSTAGLGLTVTPVDSSSIQRTVSFTPGSDVASASAQVIDSSDNPVGSPVAAMGGQATVTLGATDGDYRVRLTIRDAAGNEASVLSGAVTLDSVAPGAGGAPTVTGAGNSRNRDVTYTADPDAVRARIEVFDAQGTRVVSQPATGATTAVTLPDTDGTYSVRVVQIDAADNEAASPFTTVTLDRVPPAAGGAPTVTGAGNSQTRQVSFQRDPSTATATVEVLDSGGTVVNTVPASGSSATVTLGSSEGTYRVRVIQTDAAGNSATSATTSVEYDTTPPAAGGAPQVTGSDTARERQVAFDRDPSTTVATIEVRSQGGTTLSSTPVTGASGSITLPDADGTYVVRVIQTDAAGNDATTPPTTVTLDRQAPDPGGAPTVTGADGSRMRGVSFTRDPSAATAVVEVIDADDVVVDRQTAVGGGAMVMLGTADGDYRVRVVQTDAAGNSATSPSTLVTLDMGGPNAGGAPTVTGAVKDRARGVSFDRDPNATSAVVEILNEAGTIVDSVTATGNTASVTLPATDGTYRLRIRQTDFLGRQALSPARVVTLDTTAPNAGGAPTVTGAVSSRTRQVSFDRDPSAATAVIEVRNAAGTVVGSTPMAGSSGEITLPDLDATYTIVVVQVDAADNRATSPSVSVQLDRTPTPPGGGGGGGGGNPGGGGQPSGPSTPSPTPTQPTTPRGGGDTSVRVLSDTQIITLSRTIAWSSESGRLVGGSVVPRARCTIVGTPGPDVLRGTAGNDVICGLGGNDRIDGRGGNDIIDGGAGNDLLAGGVGNDGILGLAGNDRVTGGAGKDRLTGGLGKDRLSGGSGGDRLVGGRGVDRIAGGSGDDRFSARDRTRDRLNGGKGRDSAVADRGKRISRGVRDRTIGVERVR